MTWVVIVDFTGGGGDLIAYGPYRSRDKAYVVFKTLSERFDDTFDAPQMQIAECQAVKL